METNAMPTKTTGKVWTDEERAAMAESARERKASSKLSPAELREQGEKDLRAALAKMPPDERAMGERLHALVADAAPSLAPKTYYGMPAWAKDGKVLCFFKPASKFDMRYATFGVEDVANLDEGTMWATSWALTKLTAADEKRIAELVKQAAG